jgi:GDPmannose 4,6-dehydratase
VREFLELAFGHVGLDYKKYVEIDPKFYRPAEVEQLIGNPAKAHKKLNWTPKTKFADLVNLMVEADVKLLADSRK